MLWVSEGLQSWKEWWRHQVGQVILCRGECCICYASPFGPTFLGVGSMYKVASKGFHLFMILRRQVQKSDTSIALVFEDRTGEKCQVTRKTEKGRNGPSKNMQCLGSLKVRNFGMHGGEINWDR